MTTLTTLRFGMSRARSTLVFAALLVAACGSQAGDAGWTYAPPSATPAASPTGSPGASPTGSPAASPGGSPGATAPTGTTIELELTADLQIRQGGQRVTQIPVRGGQTYTFRITNSANFAHNFYIGTQQDLQSNNRANLEGIPDWNSGTKEMEYTFPSSGQLQYACIVPGHYTTMHGDFQIQ